MPLTDSGQHNAVPALFSKCELPVKLQLNSVVRPHLMSEEHRIITPKHLCSKKYLELLLKVTFDMSNGNLFISATDLDILVLLEVGALDSELAGLCVKVDGLHA